MIVEIHPVTGTGENYDYYYAEGQIDGKADCDKGLKYNPNGHEDSGDYGFTDGYQDGWTLAVAPLTLPRKRNKVEWFGELYFESARESKK